MKRESRRFWRGAEDGLLGTLAMSVVMVIVYVFHASTLHEPIPLGIVTRLVAAALRIEENRPIVMVIAIPIFLGYGAFWAGLVEASSERMTWWKGLGLGLGLWAIMAVFLLPFSGQFTFAVATSPAVWIATLAMHVIYGVTFGLLGERREPHRVEEVPIF